MFPLCCWGVLGQMFTSFPFFNWTIGNSTIFVVYQLCSEVQDWFFTLSTIFVPSVQCDSCFLPDFCSLQTISSGIAFLRGNGLSYYLSKSLTGVMKVLDILCEGACLLSALELVCLDWTQQWSVELVWAQWTSLPVSPSQYWFLGCSQHNPGSYWTEFELAYTDLSELPDHWASAVWVGPTG